MVLKQKYNKIPLRKLILIFVLAKSEINPHSICIRIRATHNIRAQRGTTYLRICLRMRRQI